LRPARSGPCTAFLEAFRVCRLSSLRPLICLVSKQIVEKPLPEARQDVLQAIRTAAALWPPPRIAHCAPRDPLPVGPSGFR
jgi:hypothetical protein